MLWVSYFLGALMLGGGIVLMLWDLTKDTPGTALVAIPALVVLVSWWMLNQRITNEHFTWEYFEAVDETGHMDGEPPGLDNYYLGLVVFVAIVAGVVLLVDVFPLNVIPTWVVGLGAGFFGVLIVSEPLTVDCTKAHVFFPKVYPDDFNHHLSLEELAAMKEERDLAVSRGETWAPPPREEEPESENSD